MSNKKKKEFMSLYNPVHGRFERFCKARVYGEMDFRDLMQETVIVAFEKFDEIRNTDTFLNFLFGISIRILSNSNRKIKEEKLTTSIESTYNQNSTVDKKLEIDDLYQALAKLPDNQKEALILFEISGFSIREIATLHESTEDAVKKRLSRGRQELAKLLMDTPVIA